MAENSAMNIVEFLEARIAEDEAQARTAAVGMHGEHEDAWGWGDYVLGAERDSTPKQDEFITVWWPKRVLAECAAKRAIIEQAAEATGLDMSVDNDRLVGSRDMDAEPYCGDVILSALAAIYKEHPDYRQEWSV